MVPRVVLAVVVSALGFTPVAARNLFVQDPFGQTYTLNVEPSDTIENVKQQLAALAGGLPIDRQALGFGLNDNLANGRSLADFNIPPDSTLDLRLVPLSLRFEGPLAWTGGEVLEVEFTDQAGAPETSLHSLSGLLDLNSVTSQDPVVLSLVTLYRPMSSFDPRQAYSWMIMEWGDGELLGFAADKFSIFTGDFAQSFDGHFSVTVQDGLVLNYAPVPEPAAAAAVLGFLALTGALCRRRARASRPR